MLIHETIDMVYKPIFGKEKHHKIRVQFTLPERDLGDLPIYLEIGYFLGKVRNPFPYRKVSSVIITEREIEPKYVDIDYFIDFKKEILIKRKEN